MCRHLARVQSGMVAEDMHSFFELMFALARREWQGRYRRSLLGPLWAVIQPVAYLAIFIFLRSVINTGTVEGPYTCFVFVALVPWTFFVTAVAKAAPSVMSNSGIVKKMPMRKEVFPAAAVLSALADFCLAALVLGGLMAWYHAELSMGWMAAWVVPLLFLLVLFALGMGLFFSALGTYKQDVSYAIPFAMQFWMLATPIMYPLSSVPARWREWYDLNPMVGVIEGFREAVIYNRAPDVGLLAAALLGTVIVWAVAWPLFRYMSQYFADVL